MTQLDGPADQPLRGKVAIVTGSSTGIGAATARLLGAQGASVVVNSHSTVSEGEAVAGELPDAIYVKGDISEVEDCARLVRAAEDRWGRLDILVNNAGTTQLIPHHDLDAAGPDVWRRILEVNVLGTWQMTTAAMPALRRSGAGAVVNVSSIAGVRCTGSSIPYAVSKAAINHMTALLANVTGPEVRINAVAPGLVDTPWTADWDAARQHVSATAPLRRTAQPEDVAEVCLSFVLNRHVTGQVLVVDGGMLLRQG
jgi:ketoreductase RED2